jgi:hypothetical protein
MKQAIVPLQNYHLFHRYQTREEYLLATGEEAPPFDARQAPKYWRDLAALSAPRNNVVYANVILMNDKGIAVPGPDGRPQLDALVLSRVEASKVNIPPQGTNVPGADQPEVPLPLRDLEPCMVLEFGFASVVRVRDTSVAEPDPPGAFTASDRALLQAIARKLGA